MTSLLTALPTGVLLASATGTATTPAPQASPLAEAEAACRSGSVLCSFVTEQTGSERAGAWAELLLGTPWQIFLIVVVSLVLRWVLHRLVDRAVEYIAAGGTSAVFDDQPTGELPVLRRHQRRLRRSLGARVGPAAVLNSRRAQRARTLGTLLRSIVTIVVITVAALMILDVLGMNIAPLLASAGIVGVALGFGSQSLVKDFLSGIFMIVEDQYGVGDNVNLGDAVGTVESVGLRVTQVRDVNGTLWYVPNGQITRVGNQSQGWARAVVDIAVGYGQDIAKASRVVLETAERLRENEEYRDLILEEPEVWGVERLAVNGLQLRCVVKTAPLQQWKVARELRARITEAFIAEGIAFPYAPKTVTADPAAGELPDVDSGSTPQ